MKKIIIVLLAAISISSCSDNTRAKFWGGTMEITLPPNTKLVNITWKENDVWYLTKPMVANDSAETYTFHEKSVVGLMEGKILIKEQKAK